ncbi:DUF4905 domain-containing protein [Mucilaginibacter sp. L3T2-6]|uniref:DUF4905 domain-containing protein n=1 Tax=Mucilaginibacter sp. L3T2-6 TaxID=3062491 RepID=UPI0026748B8B|nr:DUF4905 domain-containing protein [Mucilaginibacter sp. L3T2-6]MDO3642932.1 DUF4905 domain-containing protein [Mucilaginibacter sp. L3T2-6]MDV6215257.1 DUF4905 domain-containing protein [Mucilaginibacter sp. L3T2-6]
MTLSPHISQQFPSPVWRMEIDGLNDILFAEIRNNEDKSVSFSAVGLKTGEIYFDDLTTPERWLTGIEAAWDGVLLIHYYQSESGPAHKGLMAVNALNGETLWTNFSYSFDHLTAKGPVVYDSRIQPRKLFLADIKTGAATRIYEPYIESEPQNHLQIPRQVLADDIPSDLSIPHPYANWVHYLEYNNFRIVSLHALKAGTLVQTLFVFDGDCLVYEDLLNTAIQKIQPEAFILHKNCLIYIKNKTELKVLSL